MINFVCDAVCNLKDFCSQKWWSRILFVVGFIIVFLGWPLLAEVTFLAPIIKEGANLFSPINLTLIAAMIDIVTAMAFCFVSFILWAIKTILSWILFG